MVRTNTTKTSLCQNRLHRAFCLHERFILLSVSGSAQAVQTVCFLLLVQMLHRRNIPLHVCVPAIPAAETAVVLSVTLRPYRSRSIFRSPFPFLLHFHDIFSLWAGHHAYPKEKTGDTKSRRCFSRRSNPNCIQRWLCLRSILLLKNSQENMKLFFQIKIFHSTYILQTPCDMWNFLL